jgi:protein TonB
MQAGIFEEREKWSGAMLLSAGLHIALAIGVFVTAWFASPRGESWGGTSTGEAVNASLVSAVPLPAPQQPTENILANESKGLSETTPQTVIQPPDAIPIPDRQTKKKPDRTAVTNTNQVKPPMTPPKDNVVPYGQGGPVSGPYGSFTVANAKGGFSFQGGDFGSRFGWYVQQVNRTVSSHWYRTEVDPNVTSTRRVYIIFDIMRDGTPANIHLDQPSGIPSLDQSALRALQRIDTFGPLPDGYSGSKVSVEFWFDYQR